MKKTIILMGVLLLIVLPMALAFDVDYTRNLTTYIPFSTDAGSQCNASYGSIDCGVNQNSNPPTFQTAGCYLGACVDSDGTDFLEINLTQCQEWTVSVWVQFDTISAWRDILTEGSGTSWQIGGANTGEYWFTQATGSNAKWGNSNVYNWNYVTVKMYNNKNGSMYINGTSIGNKTFTTNQLDGELYYLMANSFGGGSEIINGKIDEFHVHCRALSDTDIKAAYDIFEGGGTPWNYTAPSPDIFSISALDEYDSSVLSNFSVIIKNSTNTITNSTTNGWLNYTTILTGIYNISISSNQSGGYFNRSYNNYNISTDLASRLYQAILYVNSSEIITGNKITNFTVTTGVQTKNSNSSGWATMFLRAGNYNLKATSTNYLNITINHNVSLLSEGYATINIYNSLLKINATSYIDGSTIDKFKVLITAKNFSYSTENSTTTGTLLIPLLDGKYQLNFTELYGNYSQTNMSLTLNTGEFYPNITFTPYTYNSLNISIYDEILGRSNNPFVGRDVIIEFSSELDSYNYTTNTSLLYVDLLSPLEYRITYYASDYDKRTYYASINNMTHNNIELYLLSSGNSTDVTFSVVDESGNELVDTLIYLKRYYIDTNSYRTVTMSRTNLEGQSVINLDFNDAFYKILAVYGLFSEETTGSKIFSLTPTLKITTTQDTFTNIDTLNNIITSLSLNNATKTFTYSFTSSAGPVRGNLLVQKITPKGNITICDSYDTTTSGSLLCTFTPTTDHEEFIALGRVYAGSWVITDVDSFNQWIDTMKSTFGNTGVFLSLLMAGTFAGLGSFSPVISIVMFLAGMVVIVFFGFAAIAWPVYFIIFILGAILIYKLRN